MADFVNLWRIAKANINKQLSLDVTFAVGYSRFARSSYYKVHC